MMTDSTRRTIHEFTDALSDTREDAEQRDPDAYRQRVYQQLTAHENPVLREIGEQLRDGVMRPRQLLSTPGYDQVVDEALTLLQQAKPEDVRAELARRADDQGPEKDED